MRILPLKAMRLGLGLAGAVVCLGSAGLAHADEIMRLCGPSGVGFIRTPRGQSCLYGPSTQATPPAQPSAPQVPANTAKPSANGSP